MNPWPKPVLLNHFLQFIPGRDPSEELKSQTNQAARSALVLRTPRQGQAQLPPGCAVLSEQHLQTPASCPCWWGRGSAVCACSPPALLPPREPLCTFPRQGATRGTHVRVCCIINHSHSCKESSLPPYCKMCFIRLIRCTICLSFIVVILTVLLAGLVSCKLMILYWKFWTGRVSSTASHIPSALWWLQGATRWL